MRHITLKGLQLIQHFEGFSATPYRDVAGHLTIGYGHYIAPSEAANYPANRSISREEAEALLKQDVATSEQAVLRLIYVPLSDGQFDALVSFTYNLGAGALQRSTLRRKVNRQAHAEVPAEFLRWVYAAGRKWPGLLRRRQAEAERYRAC